MKIEPEATPTKSAFVKAEPSSAESDLDALFNRLNSPRNTPAPATTERSRPSDPPDKTLYTFDTKLAGLTAADVLKSYTGDLPKDTVATKSSSPPPSISLLAKPLCNEGVNKLDSVKIEQDKPPTTTEKSFDTSRADTMREDIGIEGLEHEYMSKASQYLNSLPTSEKAATVDLVKNVAVKLRRPYTPSPMLDSGAVKSLKSQYLDTMTTYCNSLGKPGVKAVAKELLEQTLNKSHGDFLRLCAVLVDEKVLTIDTLDEVVGLCEALLRILPSDLKAETAVVKSEGEVKSVSKDPMDLMGAWPTQEKRDNRKNVLWPL
jgi:hypothetical protein